MDEDTKPKTPKKSGFSDAPVENIVGDYPERSYDEAMTDEQRAILAKRGRR